MNFSLGKDVIGQRMISLLNCSLDWTRWSGRAFVNMRVINVMPSFKKILFLFDFEKKYKIIFYVQLINTLF